MAEMRRIYGEYTADGRQICGRHKADMRLLELQTYGAGGTLSPKTYGGHS